MSALISKWLNETIGLSSKITSLEKDFSNGYYLAELLYLKGRIDNLEGFSQKRTSNDKIMNFQQLAKPLSDVGVAPKTALIRQIMTEQRGAAAKVW